MPVKNDSAKNAAIIISNNRDATGLAKLHNRELLAQRHVLAGKNPGGTFIKTAVTSDQIFQVIVSQPIRGRRFLTVGRPKS